MMIDKPEASRERSLIEAAGVFDSTYYRAAYGPDLEGHHDELDHFLAVGLTRGHAPCAGCDPAALALVASDRDIRQAFIAWCASGARASDVSLTEAFPSCQPRNFHHGLPTAADPAFVSACRDYASRAADVRAIPFVANGAHYELSVPPAGLLLDRIREGRPFAFARLPHGFWDAQRTVAVNEEMLAGDARLASLTVAQRTALATRVAGAFQPQWGVYAGSFLAEVGAMIRATSGAGDFLRAVAFRGYPTPDERLFATPEPVTQDQHCMLRTYSGMFAPEETVFDAMLWKRWALAGDLRSLPALCRPYPVILVANDAFADLGARWQLPIYRHIGIANANSHWHRWDLERRVQDAMSRLPAVPGRPPIVFTQCGGSLAYWLISRLYATRSEAFYIDLGQALNAWFFDVAAIRVMPWMRVYRPSVIDNCHLHGFYQRQLGDRYAEWFAGL